MNKNTAPNPKPEVFHNPKWIMVAPQDGSEPLLSDISQTSNKRGPRGGANGNYVSTNVRFTREQWQMLKKLQIDNYDSLQEMGFLAFSMLMQKHGMSF